MPTEIRTQAICFPTRSQMFNAIKPTRRSSSRPAPLYGNCSNLIKRRFAKTIERRHTNSLKRLRAGPRLSDSEISQLQPPRSPLQTIREFTFLRLPSQVVL